MKVMAQVKLLDTPLLPCALMPLPQQLHGFNHVLLRSGGYPVNISQGF